LAGGLGRRPLPDDARARRAQRAAPVRDPRRLSRAVLHHGRAEHACRRRRRKACGAGTAIRAGGREQPPGRALDRRRRLAHERPALEHRAAAAAQPRGADAGADGAQARRGTRGDPLVSLELGHATNRKPPFKYAAFTRVGFSATDAQGIVYYGRYLPYFDQARVEYHRHLDLLSEAMGEEQFVMRASSVEYFAPAQFDDLIEIFIRMRK